MSKSLKNINIYSFYNKYWNIRLKFDQSLCKEQNHNHNLTLEKTNRENHQCANYNYASQNLKDKYFESWCKKRNCMVIGFLTEKFVKKTLEYFYFMQLPYVTMRLFIFLDNFRSGLTCKRFFPHYFLVSL